MTRTDYIVRTANEDLFLTLAAAKLHLKVDGTADDDLITDLINACKAEFEDRLGYYLLPTDVTQYFTGLDTVLTLNFPNVSDVVVKYLLDETNRATIDAENYTVHTERFPVEIRKTTNGTYPMPYTKENSVSVEYTTGYEDADAIPKDLISAAKLWIADRYQNREDAPRRFDTAVDKVIRRYRINWF